MKKFSIALALGLTYLSANACDVCGLGTSNYNPFLFPQLSRNYISINYLHRIYHIQSENGLNKNYLNTVFVSGQYSVHEKLQLVAMLPLQLNKKELDANTSHQKGIGDIGLLANYRLAIKQGRSSTQIFTIGAGVKFPTGKYSESKSGEIENQNFQLGTGSVDYSVHASYRISFRQLVLSALSSYKYNTPNKQGYRYGDVLTTGVTAVFRKELKNISITPYLQVMQEAQLKDADNHILQAHSGGKVLYTGGGIDVNSKKITIGANYQFAARQDLFQGEINARPRISFRLSIML